LYTNTKRKTIVCNHFFVIKECCLQLFSITNHILKLQLKLFRCENWLQTIVFLLVNYFLEYIIKKLLEHKCFKGAHMTHLNIWNTSYGQKKGWESTWQFDSRPLKVKNHPDSLTCRWHTTYCWKVLDKGYNFALDLISIRGLHTKLWALKVAEVLVVRIWITYVIEIIF